MRFGRSSPFDGGVDEMPSADMEKRKSAYMRFGKRSSDDSEIEMNKRKSAYMRFGKRSSDLSDGLEMEQQVQDVNKRKSAYMRFGKRSFESVMDDKNLHI
uniref:Uncharacterized protein n=1 Tax=Panagrolaimus superbus TaxID=310955 RepID=A0A914YHY3_9BILA